MSGSPKILIVPRLVPSVLNWDVFLKLSEEKMIASDYKDDTENAYVVNSIDLNRLLVDCQGDDDNEDVDRSLNERASVTSLGHSRVITRPSRVTCSTGHTCNSYW